MKCSNEILSYVCWNQVVNVHSPGTATLGMLPFGF